MKRKGVLHPQHAENKKHKVNHEDYSRYLRLRVVLVGSLSNSNRRPKTLILEGMFVLHNLLMASNTFSIQGYHLP
jgi:hypothetical protein